MDDNSNWRAGEMFARWTITIISWFFAVAAPPALGFAFGFLIPHGDGPEILAEMLYLILIPLSIIITAITLHANVIVDHERIVLNRNKDN